MTLTDLIKALDDLRDVMGDVELKGLNFPSVNPCETKGAFWARTWWSRNGEEFSIFYQKKESSR